MIYLDYTEEALVTKFKTMGSKEIVEFLMNEGLALKSKKDFISLPPGVYPDFSDLPAGVYRRNLGQDLIRYDGYGHFNFINVFGHEADDISWSMGSPGEWWILVLDDSHNAVSKFDGFKFKVNNLGERLA